MNPAIELIGVDKRYGERLRPAVERLSLSVRPGEILGLVGPNGAGKTTTILMLAGLLQPNAGALKVLGTEVRPGLGDPRVGLSCGSLEDFDYLTGREAVLLAGRLLKLSGAEAGRRTEILLDAFKLGDADNSLITTYSSGMRQKIRVACALVGTPSVLLLDEPFEALDSTASVILAGILMRFAASGGAVLLASHDLREVERLATHYAILQSGRLLELAPMRTLAAASGAPTRSALEQRLWSTVGAPSAPDLDWLFTPTAARDPAQTGCPTG